MFLSPGACWIFCPSERERKGFGVGDSKSDVPASKNAPSGNLRHVLLQLKSVSLNLLSFLVCVSSLLTLWTRTGSQEADLTGMVRLHRLLYLCFGSV